MSRTCLSICLALVVLSGSLPARADDTLIDDTPIIVTYEMKMQRQASRLVARNPKSFWIRQILARIEAKVPVLSKPLKEAVMVKVSFVVERDGHVASRAVSTSSGNPEADRAAIAMLERAAPFPPMPAAMSDTEVAFTLPVRFH